MPSSYIVRDLTDGESRDFKHALKRAKREGRSLRWLVARLINLYARVGLEPLEAAVTSYYDQRKGR